MIKLILYADGKAVTDFIQESPKREITLGRAPGCSLRLEDPAVSRLHALIQFKNGSYIIEKKTSSGKVLVNGQEVEDAQLQGGEEIGIGKYTVRVLLEKAEEKSKASTNSAIIPDDGKTKFSSTNISALFRFEPGSANVSEFFLKGNSAIFGRAANCDVILSEKRASRRHFQVKRNGLSFQLTDLNSANGTFVNGQKITEHELNSGDVIQVGDSQCKFSIENKEYFAQESNFLPVPTEMQEATPENNPLAAVESHLGQEIQEESSQFDRVSFDSSLDSQQNSNSSNSLTGKLWNKYKSLKPTQRYLVLLLIILGVSTVLYDDEPPTKGKSKTAKSSPKSGSDGKPIRGYANLSPDKKGIVDKSYQEVISANERKDFLKMQENLSKITALIDEYKESKLYEQIARKGIEEQDRLEQERKLKAKQEEIQKAVAVLEEKGKVLFPQALKKKEARQEIFSLIQDIYSKDANNRLAQEWSSTLKAKEEEERVAVENAKNIALKKKDAFEKYAVAEDLFTRSKYRDALTATGKLRDLDYRDKIFTQKISQLEGNIKGKMDELLNPLLRDAADQKKEGGDLVKSKELYSKAMEVDPDNKEAISGLASIKEVLSLRAKKYYAEAILSESVSDLTEAKEGYEKCFRAAPDDDIYKKRCKNKLNKFEILNDK